MILNRKTERAHRALSAYLRPKLRRGADVEFVSAFVDANDENIRRRIPEIIENVMRLTHGELAYDANPDDLHKRMRAAIDDEDQEKGNVMDDDVIRRVLQLLQSRITPSELAAVYKILTTPEPKPKPKPTGSLRMTAEDARLGYDARFPSASRIGIEPACRAEPQRQMRSNPAGYFERFPDARRIGIA